MTPAVSNMAERAITWLKTGDEAFAAMLAAIESAQRSIQLEMYIYTDAALGRQFRDALIHARERGVKVQALIDALGSLTLSDHFWDSLRAAGAEVRWFNRLKARRFEFRNHRKLLVCDDEVAFIGGFNIAAEYQGDGVTKGWRDLGVRLTGNIVRQLAGSFDKMFAHAELKRKRFARIKRTSKATVAAQDETLLLCGPGWGHNPFRRSMLKDLEHAKTVKIIAAYFLPGRRMRRALVRVVKNGGRVQLIFGGKSDVPLSQMACRGLYRRLLRDGIEIYEYQPQILHAKLMIVDQAVYVGSSNLDPRSIRINYELMVRFHRREVTATAKEIFEKDLSQCAPILLVAWSRSQTWWKRLKQWGAYFLLAQVDPFLAHRQYRNLAD